MKEPITVEGHESMPEQPITLGSTLLNKTGSWKYMRPVYHNKTAPCSGHCPAGNDIQGVMDLLAQRDLDGAWERLGWENPFPSITGRVCHHPCETACNRTSFDAPLNIHHVERFLGDYGLENRKAVAPLAAATGKRVAVVGSGPAGLAGAYHLARLGHAVVVFEALSEPGGVLRYGIPENRLPKGVLKQEVQKVCDLGVEIRCNAKVGGDVELRMLESYDAVFLATGVGKSRRLGIPGEELAGVLSGLDFLKELNRGQRVELGDRVTVIGGGNTAIDVARSAIRLGKVVQIFYRRSRQEMPAIDDEIEEALAEGVVLETLLSPVRVHGRNHRVCGLELQRMTLGEPDADGRRRALPVECSNVRIPTDTVITAIGERADLDFLPASLSKSGSVVRIDRVGQTPLESVFAGGDIVDQPHTVVDAIASGKRAAMAIDMHLNGHDLTAVLKRIQVGTHGSLSMRRYLQDGRTVDNQLEVGPDQVNTDYFQHSKPAAPAQRHPPTLVQDFGEIDLGYSQEQAIGEAERCFNCGVCNYCDNCLIFCPDFAIQRKSGGRGYVVDYDYCKGCGICAVECPRHVIEMVREGVSISHNGLGPQQGRRPRR